MASHSQLVSAIVAVPMALASALVFGAQLDDLPPPEPREPAPPTKPHFERMFDVSQFQKGNLHTHTKLSDGDTPPEKAIIWYRSHGYQFLALTDHNVRSDPARYALLQEPGFVLLSGEEISMTGHGHQVHVNALCTHTRIPGGTFGTASAALGYAISQVLIQGGIPIVNHPNFDWALGANDVMDARDAPLLEVASAHPYVHSAGNALHPGHERLWDIALTSGARIMGVAVDDVHRFDVSGYPLALPGHAWVQAFGDHADETHLCAALAQGRLYSSTGITLKRIAVTEDEYTVEPLGKGRVDVVFVGSGGRELARIPLFGDGEATYRLSGNEGYVRARVDGARGEHAFTPAVHVAAGH